MSYYSAQKKKNARAIRHSYPSSLPSPSDDSEKVPPRWYYFDKNQMNTNTSKSNSNLPVTFYNCSSIIVDNTEEAPATSQTPTKKSDETVWKNTYTATAPSMEPFVTGMMLDLSNLSELGKFPVSLQKILSPK